MRRSVFLTCLLAAAAFGSAAPLSAQNSGAAGAPRASLPPEARYAPGTSIPTAPEAFVNESDEKGYSTSETENPPSN